VRGDVHALKAPRGARGSEQAGRRFAVILQSDLLPLSTVLVAPTSTRAQEASFRPEVVIEGRTTLVLVEQTVAVDPGRLGPLVGHLTHDEMTDIRNALRTVLDLR
jgi:mRNA interferase MazF